MTDEKSNEYDEAVDPTEGAVLTPRGAGAIDAADTAAPLTDEATWNASAVGSSQDTSGDVAPQYGVGPFTVRELAIGGVWLIAFVVSFFSLSQLGFVSVWTRGIDWILMIGVPTAAVFLLALRRLSPSGIRRVGSLGIDQFASVAFTVAAVVWLEQVWLQVSVAASGGLWETTWVVWVELALMLAGVVLTVFAPLIPVFEEDFQGRPDTTAHRSSRPIRAVVARPRSVTASSASPASAAAAESSPGAYETGAYDTGAQPVLDQSSDWADPFAAAEQPAQQHQAFWALAPEERDVLDESGIPLFRVGPAAWALVIEDRGAVYVVRHEDGRIGYLHDVSGVTRG